MFDGDDMSSTTFILNGFASIPRLLTIKPKKFPVETPKSTFGWIQLHVVLFQDLEGLSQMSYMELDRS